MPTTPNLTPKIRAITIENKEIIERRNSNSACPVARNTIPTKEVIEKNIAPKHKY